METFQDIKEKLEIQRKYVKSKELWNVEKRKYYLKKLHETIEAHRNEIIDAVDADLGVNRFKTVYVEVDKTLIEIEKSLSHIDAWAKPKKVSTPLLLFPAKSYIYSEPYGQCLVISPWNYPVNLALIPAVGAIAAGNSVVIKPSEISSNTAKIIAKVIEKALPTEVAFVVEGAVEETTYLLDQKFDHIFYTGNGTVGRIIMQKAAKNLTPVVLELGGKSPVLVHTKNLDIAARRIVFGKFFNCGQTCIAPDYILIPKKDKADFVKYAEKWLKEFFKNTETSPDYGRIISDRHYDRLEGMLEGSKVIVDMGRNKETRYFGPTIVECNADAKVMQDEIFGPILPLIESESLEDSIEFVNERDKPLACYGFIDNDTEGEKIIRSISAGGMVINDALIHFANGNLPFGGVGESGIGAYHGDYSFGVFSHKKSVMKTGYVFENSLRYPPYEKKSNIVLKLAKLLG